MLGFADGLLAWARPIDWALAVAVLLAGTLALLGARRGGQFRELPGWGGLWLLFGVILICLSRGPLWLSFTLLGGTMFVALRAYFSAAPVRTRDRFAILAAYLAIPFALWPAYSGHHETFLATVPVTLFLLIPVFLSIGPPEAGMLDSMGRTLLGVLFFVFCLAHLGLLAHQQQDGLPQLFGILVLASEVPQRLARRFRGGGGWIQPTLGILLGGVLAVSLGFELAPWCGLVEEDGGRAGLLVVIAVTLGAQVSNAVSHDLSLTTASSRFGRGAILNRMVPAVYASPVFFHYLNHFA